MMVFRVATYNVHKCKGMDWRVSPARIADVIGCLESEILATQEILLSQAGEISKRLGTPFIFGTARQHAGEPYGNAIFTKLPFVSHQNHDLTISGREQRQCLRVSLLLPEGRTVHFFALHLGTSFTERRKQARQLLSSDILACAQFQTHRIVVGDFNEWTRGLASQLLSQHMESADIVMHLKRGTTYPGILPFLHLDHIYYDRDFELRDMHLYRTKLSLLASDHLPLVATFAV
ncbi:MAG TPA: endonuclease/exonuclease/phosphatase family protein [Bryobacteraceae bacterium]